MPYGVLVWRSGVTSLPLVLRLDHAGKRRRKSRTRVDETLHNIYSAKFRSRHLRRPWRLKPRVPSPRSCGPCGRVLNAHKRLERSSYMILVTGGMGFIGLHVVRSLLDEGEGVVVTWNRSWRVPDFWQDDLGKRVIAERVDVANAHEVTAVAMKHRVDGVVHLVGPPLGATSP